VQVIGVQPRANCAMHDSLAQSRALTTYRSGGTLCEGLEGPVAPRTFALAREHVDSIVLVEEDEILQAIAFAYRALGFLVEPSAAVTIAAVRAGRIVADDDAAVVLTGGNIDADLLDRALDAG
jgi:threonine dehydratase